MKSKKLVLPTIIFLVFMVLNLAAADYGVARVAILIKVVDGDTILVDVQNWQEVVGKHIYVRFAGIDTPEKNSEKAEVRALAQKAREFTAEQLQGAKIIELRNIRRDKYFRLLAEVWADGVNLSEELIKAGLAKPYDGGKKATEW